MPASKRLPRVAWNAPGEAANVIVTSRAGLAAGRRFIPSSASRIPSTNYSSPSRGVAPFVSRVPNTIDSALALEELAP